MDDIAIEDVEQAEQQRRNNDRQPSGISYLKELTEDKPSEDQFFSERNAEGGVDELIYELPRFTIFSVAYHLFEAQQDRQNSQDE